MLRRQPIRQPKNKKKVVRKEILGGYGGGVPPLPIPNREVKPTCADGTAMQCGRVGSRLLLTERVLRRKSWNSFFCLNTNFYELFTNTYLNPAPSTSKITLSFQSR